MTDNLRELLAAATPGPWPADYVRWAVRHIARNVEFPEGDWPETWNGWDRYNDAPLIAALVNAAPLLLDVVDAARAHQTATATATLHPTYPNVEAMHHSWQAVDRALAALDKATEVPA